MDYTVRLTFLNQETGAVEYIFPYVYQVDDPKEGMKATIIHGNRGDGAIVIPGGKKSQNLVIRGRIFDNAGYKDITDAINEMKSAINTDLSTLTMEHLEGAVWTTDWSYTVRRTREITFPESLRTGSQRYEATFLVVAY